jgi:hypothetical protein
LTQLAENCSVSCRGEVINGGFGLVLDGTAEAEQKARMMLSWDVSNGVSPPELFSSSIPPLLQGSAYPSWKSVLQFSPFPSKDSIPSPSKAPSFLKGLFFI